MLERQECIDRIKANTESIVSQFGVTSLRLFGSFARNQQRESSDVDIVRKHRNNNEFLLKQIEKDGIDIIKESASSFAYA